MGDATNNDSGFTLIELIIVVAIIGVLAAIAIPALAGYRVRAYNSGAVADVRGVKMELEVFYADNRRYP